MEFGDLGDCLGSESCEDFKTMAGGVEEGSSSSGKTHRRSYSTGDMPPPMSPMILRRYHTDDGRLVILGEKMKGREYFHADRSDGRLTLRLVPICDDSDGGDSDVDLDDDENCSGDGEVDFDFDFKEEEKEADLTLSGEDKNGCAEKETNVAAAAIGRSAAVAVAIPASGVGGREGHTGHLYQYCNMSRSPCLLGGGGIGVVPAIRSVHT